MMIPPTLRRLDVLIACETSGRMRDQFILYGHNAVSCDLLPTKVPGPHIQGDVLPELRKRWDLVVAHPPCPKLTVAAAWCMYHPDDKHLPYEDRRPHPKFPNRRAEQDEAAEFFMACVNANAEVVIVENPVGVMSRRYRQPDQILQPYYFGDDASKKTCLWIEGTENRIKRPPPDVWHPGRWVLDPKLGRTMQRWSNQTDSGQNRLGPSDDRWDARSETYPGIAVALGETFGL